MIAHIVDRYCGLSVKTRSDVPRMEFILGVFRKKVTKGNLTFPFGETFNQGNVC